MAPLKPRVPNDETTEYLADWILSTTSHAILRLTAMQARNLPNADATDRPTEPHPMEVFELVVTPGSYELHQPNNSEGLKFPTLLSAFAFAQRSMSGEQGEMVVHGNGSADWHVPLYRLTA